MHTKWARPPQLQASGGRHHPTRIYSVSRIQSRTSEAKLPTPLPPPSRTPSRPGAHEDPHPSAVAAIVLLFKSSCKVASPCV